MLAVAEALRKEADFEVRICLKRVQGFALQPSLKEMLKGHDVIYTDRGADRDLLDAIKWADVVHLQNAPPDVAFFTRFFRKPLILTIHNYMARPMTLHRLLWRLAAKMADERWYNSQFVWDTWEPHRKSPGSRKGADSLKPAGRLDAAGAAAWFCIPGPLDREQGDRHPGGRVRAGADRLRAMAADVDGRWSAAQAHRVRDSEARDRRRAGARIRG